MLSKSHAFRKSKGKLCNLIAAESQEEYRITLSILLNGVHISQIILVTFLIWFVAVVEK